MTVCFHGHNFVGDFVLASITVPIIGAEFLCANSLLMDVADRQLSDALSFTTFPWLTGGSGPLTHTNFSTAGTIFQSVLADFPSLITPVFSAEVARHGVEHFTPTTGPSIFACAHRLDAAKLASAREEFATTESLGILRRSKSPWASLLHMVPKTDGTWQPCGDFRRPNNVTTQDRYAIPHIQDFSFRLAGIVNFFLRWIL